MRALAAVPAARQTEGRAWSPTPTQASGTLTPRGCLPARPTHQDRLLQTGQSGL